MRKLLMRFWHSIVKPKTFYEEGDFLKFIPVKRVAGYTSNGKPIHIPTIKGWVMSEYCFKTTKQHVLMLDIEKRDMETDFDKSVKVFIYEADQKWYLKSDVDKKCPYTCEIVYQR